MNIMIFSHLFNLIISINKNVKFSEMFNSIKNLVSSHESKQISIISIFEFSNRLF